jgi:SAM-dependent methyltransferase
VAEVGDTADLPFDDGAFDLVISRHPVATRWDEVARVLRPGGRYFAQHVSSGSNHELTDFLMGPQPIGSARRPEVAVAAATSVGLEVVDLQEATMRVEFFDIGAVVYFLRKVIWTVPDFGVDRYRDRLRALHRRIQSDGAFVSTAPRFLIELAQPGG